MELKTIGRRERNGCAIEISKQVLKEAVVPEVSGLKAQ
jgi:hypothetical protein